MILLTGIPSERPLELVIEACQRQDIPYALFNQREAHHSQLTLEIKDGQVDGVIRLRETDYPLSGFDGVYVRMMDHRHLPEVQEDGILAVDPQARDKSLQFHELFLIWLEVAEARIMNRGRNMRSNGSKPYQAQFITASGLLIPPTCITNDPAVVQAFRKEHGRVIYKSTSSVRSIVQELVGFKVNELDSIRFLPTQFQALIEGTDIRVHVVGDMVFPTEIRSQAVDYRYASRDDHDVEMVAITLEPAIEEACLDLSRRLKLPLCGIDLLRTAAGEYYCFEVNPSPGFSYFQENSGQDIAGAIAHYLAFGSTRLPERTGGANG